MMMDVDLVQSEGANTERKKNVPGAMFSRTVRENVVPGSGVGDGAVKHHWWARRNEKLMHAFITAPRQQAARPHLYW